MGWKQIKSKHKKMVNKVPTQLPYVDLRGRPMDWSAYQDEIRNIFDRERMHGEHCQDYEDLTMEEKLLVDADIKFLFNEELLKAENSLIFWSGMEQYTLEKCLARLRKRDRKNDKRN